MAIVFAVCSGGGKTSKTAICKRAEKSVGVCGFRGGDEVHNFIVVVEDNFGNSYELEFDFNNRNVKDDGDPIGNFKPLTR